MKNLLYLGIILILASCGSNEEEIKEEERYDVSETVNPTDTLMSLKADMKPLNGVVFCQLGDIGKYVNGKKEGVQKSWYESGQLESEKNYKDGKAEGIQKWWNEDGQLEDERNYKDGEKHGVQKSWYRSGQLFFELNCKDGEKDGVQKSWYDDGQLYSELNYKDGKAEGIQKWWNEDGQLEDERNYKDGKLINQYSSSTILIGDLEVMTEDLGEMSWGDAKKACAALGDGWRLPTRDELNVLCENKDKIGGFAGNYYWSSRRLWSNTEKDFTSWSWGQSFPSGYEFTSGNYSNYYVRAVRAF